MFKLPICPYCHTVYGYKDVLNNKKKIATCYHCKRKFKQSRIKGFMCLFICAVFIAMIINILIINLTGDVFSAIVPMFIISIVIVIIAVLISPFFVRYKKLKGENEKYIKKQTIETTDIKNKKIKKSVKYKMRKEKDNQK